MIRAPGIRIRTVAFVLGALGLLTGVAWADPSGAANIRQFPIVATFLGTETLSPQRTFLTTDPIIAQAIYYDPADACLGANPVTVKFFVFNLEGQLILGRNRDTTGDVYSAPDEGLPKYQVLSAFLAPSALAPGSYNLVFRVDDCTTTYVSVSDFYSIEVFTP
jgi:hypothetical protein